MVEVVVMSIISLIEIVVVVVSSVKKSVTKFIFVEISSTIDKLVMVKWEVTEVVDVSPTTFVRVSVTCKLSVKVFNFPRVNVVQFVSVGKYVVSVTSFWKMVVEVISCVTNSVVEVITWILRPSMTLVVTGINRETVDVLVMLAISTCVIVLGGISFDSTTSDVSLLITRLEISVFVVLTRRLTIVLAVSVNVSLNRSVFVPLEVFTGLVMLVLVEITTRVTVLVVDRETLVD